MSLEQAAAFGEAASLNASNNEIFVAIENLDRGIAILEKHLNRTTQNTSSKSNNNNILSPTAVEIEKSELRARLFDFLSRKADLLLSSGGTSAALNTSLLMCSTDPRNAQGFFVAGQALRKLKRYEQAVDYLTTASKLDNNQSIQIRQCLELAITELRMPSSVEMLNNSGLNNNGIFSPAGIASSTTSRNNNNNSDEFDFDVESVLRFAQKYVPTASQLKKQAKEKPAQAAGVCVGILILLMILISFETIMFGICFGIVVALHKWEKRICSQRGIILYRVPVLEIPLNVLTCAFLSVSGVYFLLM